MADTLLREANPAPGSQAVPKPQHWSPTLNNGQGGWEVTEGENGALYMMRKTARKQDAIIPAGETVSTPVDISGAESLGFVLPEAMTGNTLYFEVSDGLNGTWHALYYRQTRLFIWVGEAVYNAAVATGSDELLRPWQYMRLVSSAPTAAEVAEAGTGTAGEAAERRIEVHMK